MADAVPISMMRTLVPMLTSAAMLIAGTAVAEPSGDPFESKVAPLPSDQTMSAGEVIRYALPYLPRVARCYQRHALPDRRASGAMELYLVIARNGNVVHSEVNAPGLTVFRLAYLERCVKREVALWHFPIRKGFTNAVIPYYFLHTKTPESGPFPSCWNPKGCPTKEPQ